MRAISKLNPVAALAVLLAATPLATAESKYTYSDVEKKLGEKYTVTVVNAEGGLVTTGVTLTLKKSGLTAGSSFTCVDDYKEGRISLGGNILQRANCVRVAGTGVGAPARSFVIGEKLYVTRIEVKDTIAFSLISDAIGEVTYKAELRFQLPKGTSPDAAQADRLIAEVFSSAAPEAAQGGQAAAPPRAGAQPDPALTPIAPPPPPQDQPLAPIVPPPPPPDAPAAQPQTLGLGMTVDQVVAILGQPQKVATVGTKQIYSYANLKVTFVNGKVTDVQ